MAILLAKLMLNCPYCNSEQQFPLRHEQCNDSSIVINVYIACVHCPYKHVIRRSTKQLENLRTRELLILKQAEAQVQRYGKRTSVNELALMRVHKLMKNEEELLQ